MRVLSNDNHVIRKVLKLSPVEMMVLCDIAQMSNSPDTDYWCRKSKEAIADWLDISRATVYNSMKSLQDKGYIERSDKGARPTRFIRNLETQQEKIGLWVQVDGIDLVSENIRHIFGEKTSEKDRLNFRPTVQNLDGTVQILDGQAPKNSSDTPSKFWTVDIKDLIYIYNNYSCVDEKSTPHTHKRHKTISKKNEEGTRSEATLEEEKKEKPSPRSAAPPPAAPEDSPLYRRFLEWCQNGDVGQTLPHTPVTIFWKFERPLTSVQFDKLFADFNLTDERRRNAFKEECRIFDAYKPFKGKTLADKNADAYLTFRNWLNRSSFFSQKNNQTQEKPKDNFKPRYTNENEV